MNFWRQKFVTADNTAALVNSQHGIQWQGQDFDKNINTLNIRNFFRIC